MGVLGAGVLLSAICGHWIANLLFDAREFTQAGLEYTWRANISILIQTLVVLIVVALLGPLSKRRRAQSLIRPARSTLAPSVGLLIASQLVPRLRSERTCCAERAFC